MGDTLLAGVHVPTEKYVSEWQKCWHSEQRHTLTYRRTADGILIDYNWGPERQGTHTLFEALALMYESCTETMHTAEQVAATLRNSPEAYDYPAEEIQDALDEFCRARLMISEDGKYLSLAIPSNPNW